MDRPKEILKINWKQEDNMKHKSYQQKVHK